MTFESKPKDPTSGTPVAPLLEEIGTFSLEGRKLFENSLSEKDQLRARFRIAAAATVARATAVSSTNEALYRKKVKNAWLFVTEVEIETLTELISEKSQLSEPEIRKIRQYRDDLIRSQNFNFALAALRYIDDEKEANDALVKLSTAILNQMKTLKESENLYLDFSTSGHSMRLSITKEPEGVCIRLFETRGFLDYIGLDNFIPTSSTTKNASFLFQSVKPMQHNIHEIYVAQTKIDAMAKNI